MVGRSPNAAWVGHPRESGTVQGAGHGRSTQREVRLHGWSDVRIVESTADVDAAVDVDRALGLVLVGEGAFDLEVDRGLR